VMPTALTILVSAFPPERRGATVGIWGGLAGLAIASGPLGPALLHAALFDAGLQPIVLFQTLFSWQDVVQQRSSTTDFTAIVPDALGAYDLPDLAACLAPRRLLVLNPLDAVGGQADPQQVQVAWEVTCEAYRMQRAESALTLETGATEARIAEAQDEWRQHG